MLFLQDLLRLFKIEKKEKNLNKNETKIKIFILQFNNAICLRNTHTHNKNNISNEYLNAYRNVCCFHIPKGTRLLKILKTLKIKYFNGCKQLVVVLVDKIVCYITAPVECM